MRQVHANVLYPMTDDRDAKAKPQLKPPSISLGRARPATNADDRRGAQDLRTMEYNFARERHRAKLMAPPSAIIRASDRYSQSQGPFRQRKGEQTYL